MTINRTTQRTLRRLGVALVYLYGSTALGRSSAMSDVDVGVVMKRPARLRPFAVRAHLYRKLHRRLGPIVNPKDRRELDLVLLQTASPILQFEAIRGGRLLFVDDRVFQADYEAVVLRDYLDVRPLVEVHYQTALARAA